MHPIDILRELHKAIDAVDTAVTHLRANNQANAALHLSDEVLYSPLTIALMAASEGLERCCVDIGERVDADLANAASQAHEQQFADDGKATDG